jgi:hypothetical protein
VVRSSPKERRLLLKGFNRKLLAGIALILVLFVPILGGSLYSLYRVMADQDELIAVYTEELFLARDLRRHLSEQNGIIPVFILSGQEGLIKDFEKANLTKHTLFALNHIQDISLIKNDVWKNREGVTEVFRIESYDIAHMSGKNVVGVMTVIEDGEIKKSEYRKFKIKEDPGANDTKALKEVLSRRLAHIEWREPNLIVVDGGVAQKRVMEKILQENTVQIPVVSVVKDDRHKPKEILGDKKWLKYEREILLSNSEAHRYAINFHKHI